MSNINDIHALPMAIKDVFDQRHYKIDYYQRDYVWGREQITSLISDLTNEFLRSYKLRKNDEYSEIETYNQYFLGSILLNKDDSSYYIVDGQQRMTSLTLIFCYLSKRLRMWNNSDDTLSASFNTFVYSNDYESKKFNIDAEERSKIMNIILKYSDEKILELVKKPQSESDMYFVRNYIFIKKHLDEMIEDNILKHFAYWLSRRVLLVSITTNSSESAYTIFETLNDRGLSLSKTEMLKGYILSNIHNMKKREENNNLWKKISNRFESHQKFEYFISSFLKAKYARNGFDKDNAKNRENRAEERRESFDATLIQNSFHNFLKKNKTRLLLNDDESYQNIIELIDFYSKIYLSFESLASKNEQFARVFFSGYPSLLVAVIAFIDEKDKEINEKISIISQFLTTRMLSKFWQNTTYSKDTNELEFVIKAANLYHSICKHKNKETLGLFLINYNMHFTATIENNKNIVLINGEPKSRIYWVLSIMTSEVDKQAGLPGNISNMYAINTKGSIEKLMDIEHLFAKNYKNNSSIFKNQEELDAIRDNFEALTLLDKMTNSSLNNSSLQDKLIKYPEHNRLTGILGSSMYEESTNELKNQPGMKRFFSNGIKLHSFNLDDVEASLEQRLLVYAQISRHLSNEDRILDLLNEKDVSSLETKINKIDLESINKFFLASIEKDSQNKNIVNCKLRNYNKPHYIIYDKKDEVFKILKGTEISDKSNNIPNSAKKIRDDILKAPNQVVNKDIEAKYPSAVCSIVIGLSLNGKEYILDENDLPFSEWN